MSFSCAWLDDFAKSLMVRKAALVLMIASLLSGCGWLQRLFGDDGKDNAHELTPVDPIEYKELLKLLPQVEGWKTESKEGKFTDVREYKISRASAKYGRQGQDTTSSIRLEIVDGAYVPEVYSRFAVMAHSRGEPHKLASKFEGHPGIEQWDTETGKVTLAILVARRFVVTLNGSQVTPEEVRRFVHATGLAKLAEQA